MRRLFFLLLILKSGTYAQTPSPVSDMAEAHGALPTASATTNTGAIQAALTTTGLVTLSGCGTYNVNGHLNVSSNTHFRVAPCVTLKQADNTNDNMLVNSAYTRRGFITGTITYVSGASGCPANTTQFVQFSGGGGAFLYGSISINGSGAPTGNVTITNQGSWYNAVPTAGTIVTAETPGQSSGSPACTISSATFSGGTLNGGTTSVSLVQTSGTQITVTWNSHGFTALQSYVAIWGVTPTMYNGVFLVETVPDGNHFTYRTNRLPTAAPSGTPVGLAADSNITIDGGAWNYNANGQSGVNGFRPGCTMILFACANCRIRDVQLVNPTQDNILAGAVRDFYVSDSTDSNSSSRQFIKIVGPVYNAKLERIVTQGTDDGLTISGDEGLGYNEIYFSSGDVQNAGFDTISKLNRGGSTGLVVFFASNFQVGIGGTAPLYMGGLYAKNISGNVAGGSNLPCVGINNLGLSTAVIDTVSIENVNGNCTWSVRTGSVPGNAYTINALRLKDITCNPLSASAGDSGQTCIEEDAAGTINSFVIDGMTASSTASTATAQLIIIGGTVNALNLGNITNTTTGTTGAYRLMAMTSAANVKKLTIDKYYQSTAPDTVIQQIAGLPNIQEITVRDSNITAPIVLNLFSNTNVYLDNNIFNNALTGVIQTNGNITVNVYSHENNLTGSGLQWAKNPVSGTPAITWRDYGNQNFSGFPSGTGVTVAPQTPCIYGVAPAIGSGFNGATSITGTSVCAFTLQVGTGTAGTQGVINFPFQAPAAWACQVSNASRFAVITQIGPFNRTSATFNNGGSGFSAINWTNNDVLGFNCWPR